MSAGSSGRRMALYVHVPFCAHACHYCDYAVEPAARPPVDAWLGAVERELELRAEREQWEHPPELSSVYVGGGTPSLLGRAGMEALARVLTGRFHVPRGTVEWTAEANPSSLDGATAAAWREVGVNRLSLGVQSLDDGVLRWLGRLHDARRARRAVEAARDAGFEALSVDLLYGLPEGIDRDWAVELERIVELGAPHLSLYGLTVESGTPLGRWVAAGTVTPAGEDRVAEEYLRASRVFTGRGWEHYETGRLCRPGHRSRHGVHTWSGGPRVGIGPSAHGAIGGRRYRNVSAWSEYRKAVAAGRLPVAISARPDARARRSERIWLRLRTREGLPEDLSRAVRAAAPDLVRRLEAEGWLRSSGTEVALTPRGWTRIDAVAAAVISALEDSPAGTETAAPDTETDSPRTP